MGRWYSYSGSKPSQGQEIGGKPQGFQFDDPKDDPRFAEFFAARKDTSHTVSGLDVGHDEQRGNVQFRGDAARVVHEEHDQHTGEVHTIVQRSSRVGSGTQRVTWKPDGPRRLVISDTKPTTD